jgi:hypothetical protein
MTPAAQTVHAARMQVIRAGGVLPPLPAQLVHSNATSVPVTLISAIVDRAPGEIVTLAIERV